MRQFIEYFSEDNKQRRHADRFYYAPGNKILTYLILDNTNSRENFRIKTSDIKNKFQEYYGFHGSNSRPHRRSISEEVVQRRDEVLFYYFPVFEYGLFSNTCPTLLLVYLMLPPTFHRTDGQSPQ